MKLIMTALILSSALPLSAQEGGKWTPYQFAGNERFEYKNVTTEGEEKKESGFILDLRKKGEEDFEVTVSTRSVVKRDQGAEILALNMGMGMSPAILLMNPGYAVFFQQVEFKTGEKVSLFGAGVIKVGAKQTVGGRSGWACQMFTAQDGKDVLVFEWTIDPALALPIRSVMYEEGKEKFRLELVSYKRD